MRAFGIRSLGRLGALLLLSVAPALAQEYGASDTAQAVHLLQRATYGVRTKDLEEVLRIGPEAWLERQLHPEQIPDDELEQLLREYPGAILPVAGVYQLYGPPSRDEIPEGDSLSAEAAARRRQRLANQRRARLTADLMAARLLRAIHSERQLQEVMVGFWLDHFNIHLSKGQIRWLVGDYERNAIRPHVFGTFEELLIAVASHPAMLYYLDNWRSSAPRPAVAARAGGGAAARRGAGVVGAANTGVVSGGRQPRDGAAGQQREERGINENYARELLELHTLGVDGGYTQQDVIEVARILTGWTVRTERVRGTERGRTYEYIFRSTMHDVGAKEVLGVRFPAGGGEEEGERLLRMLARHPSTARHISRKLVERFVSDDPPQELVDTLTAVYLRTGGDLREVTRTLFTSTVFRDPAYMRAKIKRPFELVVSAIRATDAKLVGMQGVTQTLRTFGHLPYMEPAPAGYPVQKADWVNSGAMLNRMNFGLSLGNRTLRGVELPEDGWWEAAVRAGSRDEMVSVLANKILPGVPTAELESIIHEDLAGNVGRTNSRRLAARALGLILGSPEFQRH